VTAQGGARQDRRDAFQPQIGPPDILSADALMYVEAVPALQRAATQDSTYNGEDAGKRLRGSE
jgi:hypothetical protein